MTVELYVQVVPEWSPFRHEVVRDVKIAKITRTRPDEPVPGARLVKVVIDVPVEQFLTQAIEVRAPDVPAIRAVS